MSRTCLNRKRVPKPFVLIQLINCIIDSKLICVTVFFSTYKYEPPFTIFSSFQTSKQILPRNNLFPY